MYRIAINHFISFQDFSLRRTNFIKTDIDFDNNNNDIFSHWLQVSPSFCVKKFVQMSSLKLKLR